MDNPDLMKAMAYRDGGRSETVAETLALKGHEGLGDPVTGRPRSYEEKLAMENQKLANAPDDPNRKIYICLLYTSPSPRDATLSRMPSSA